MSLAIPILSITIPTYNRKELLSANLVRLVKQIEKFSLQTKIEIVISDNCSTDGTDLFVENLIQDTNVAIVYNKNKENIGAIKNILNLITLSKGKFWMFYGDDDPIADEVLPKLIDCFEKNQACPTFIFKNNGYLSTVTKEYVEGQHFSIADFAQKYFYYIGNAGAFAVNTELAKQALHLNYDNLLKTCWPQTEVFFIAMYLSQEQHKVYASTLISKGEYHERIRYPNSYYFFETTLYSLLRSALSIEKITQNNFTQQAILSIYGLEFFSYLKYLVVEYYFFYDYPEEKTEFTKSLKEALGIIPERYKKEIVIINKFINKPKIFVKTWLYFAYLKACLSNDLKLFKKIILLSPVGYMHVINNKRKEKMSFYLQKDKKIITSQSGYF